MTSSSPTTPPASSGPLPIEEVLGGTVSLSELRADGGDLLWLESRPHEDGRMTIQRLRAGTVTEVTPTPTNVRTRIWEYGGGAWDVCDGVVVVSDLGQERLLVLDGRGTRTLTPTQPQIRFGGLQVHPERDLVLAVREDHRGGVQEPVSTIVALRLSGSNEDFGTVLVEGADFHAGPRLSEDGQLAWFQWSHSDMPWDQSAVHSAALTGGPGTWALSDAWAVLDLPGGSAQHPQWDGQRLVFTHDGSGWWNLYAAVPNAGAFTVSPLTQDEADHDHPVWTLTLPCWAPDEGRVLQHRMVEGWPVLGWLEPEGTVTGLPVPGLAEVDSVAVVDGLAHVLASFADRPPALISVSPTSSGAEVKVLHQPTPTGPVRVPGPRSVVVEGPSGPVQAWFHAPAGPGDEAAPTIVRSHGGPTSFASAALTPSVTFWTSRGFAVVDVNYGGSTGFGRAYRERLKGQWGVVDVADCVALVEHLVAQGVVDPGRVSITGGSAGGYTTLQSLVTTRTYTAGVSRYGIGDLELLATDTHKFESHYLDSLVGAYPSEQALYRERSPIHHLDGLATPMLILQGLDDKVVPPNQAEAMAAAVRDKGLPVALVMFAGEGHGFRGLAARRQALLTELAFHVQLWGLPNDEPGLPQLDVVTATEFPGCGR